MTVYALAQITIHDRARYDRYAAAFPPVLARYGGKLLAADTAPRVVEGDWPHQKAVLLSFDSREDFERWSTSAEYREISRDREAATDGVVLLLDGIGHAWPA
ncbi:DUF1330 domain-containing protein [Micromonospora sp. WMMA1949]|uniref:DUF1330 domain-containing protein n=1 Tax=unclassified Micromonospora TaxID=2617518 RepID=UPI0022B600B2|nr:MULTISPECIES: DUF1330 domain-containing protein [unclassified Micromonospora]MCZ7429230.1 DUF1330 domain-containing protein [Micromonospora sp. WMMA1949]WBC08094.1 DUF1330 domain-containing protein [Micromonospora sp. WMMA1947]